MNACLIFRLLLCNGAIRVGPAVLEEEYWRSPGSLRRLQEDVDVPRIGPKRVARGLMAYLLDANVFIAAKNLHYGLDFCPAFWEWLVASHSAGFVYSVENPFDMLRRERARFVLGPNP